MLDQGRIVGIVDESDLLLAVSRDEAAFRRPVRDFMSTRLTTVEADAPPAEAQPATTDLSPCAICDARSAIQRCIQCERPVCRDDVWTMLGLCKQCATEDEVRKVREGSKRPRPDLGIKWIQD